MSGGCCQSSACEHLATALPRQFVDSRPYSCCLKALLLLLLETTAENCYRYSHVCLFFFDLNSHLYSGLLLEFVQIVEKNSGNHER